METKNGHKVEVIEGDADGIVARGREIEDLGDQMIGAAGVLKAIGDGATEQRGRSIESIQKEVGDAHEELKLAGERYQPTGTVMKDYGNKLALVQAAMRTIVADAEAAETALRQKQAAAEQAATTAGAADEPDPTDTTEVERVRQLEEAATTAGTAVGTAESDLDDQFALFDTQWDTWDRAYDDALAGINDATDGNISDGWRDNVSGFVEVALEVLSWVGVALLVLALVIGGPIIAILAVIVGVLALIGTLYLYSQGRRGRGDVGLAVIGVLPFGKLAKVFKGGDEIAAGLKGFLKGPFGEFAENFGRVRSLSGLVRGSYSAARAGGQGRIRSLVHFGRVFTRFSNFGGAGVRNIPLRIVGGSNRAYTEAFADAFASFPASGQAALTAQLKNLPRLSSVLSTGQGPLTTADKIFNTGEFAMDRIIQGYSRSNAIRTQVQSGPVDTWRAQLQ